LADIFTKEKRSEIMSKIGPKNTKPELLVRRELHRFGYRYRLHKKELPGKPDIVFPKLKKVIFIHGCFWHGHKHCKRSKLPDTNKEFWLNKISKNKKNDKLVKLRLTKMEWSYLVIWQCQIEKNLNLVLKKVVSFINR
jgi:DNA mismatch endonuclease (patch repair protein)